MPDMDAALHAPITSMPSRDLAVWRAFNDAVPTCEDYSFSSVKAMRMGLYEVEPEQEENRLLQIRALDLLGDGQELRFTRFVEQSARELNLPMAVVSLVLGRIQYFVAMFGGEGWIKVARSTPIEWSFCAYSVKRGRTFIVQDATKHPLVKDNPLVTCNGIRCYAGAPLTLSNGTTIGALAVLGTEPRQFLPSEIDRLHELAEQVVAEIERSRPRLEDLAAA